MDSPTKPIGEPTFAETFSKDSSYNYIVSKSNTSNSSNEDQDFNMAAKKVAHYVRNQKEFREHYPILHYFCLCALVFAAFVSMFIGPVIFGMLAAIGGFATPIVLSAVGGGMGLIFGIVFGIVFSVVCIVALVKALGTIAEKILDTLWYGGNDLMVITKQQVYTYINPRQIQN